METLETEVVECSVFEWKLGQRTIMENWWNQTIHWSEKWKSEITDTREGKIELWMNQRKKCRKGENCTKQIGSPSERNPHLCVGLIHICLEKSGPLRKGPSWPPHPRHGAGSEEYLVYHPECLQQSQIKRMKVFFPAMGSTEWTCTIQKALDHLSATS